MIRIESNETQELHNKAQEFLESIKPLLYTNECTFRESDKNLKFDKRYPLTHEQKIGIIKKLDASDCIMTEPNDNPRYKDSEVYAFVKDQILTIYGEEEPVTLYIKMYRSDLKSYDVVIVISFHEEGMFD